MAVMNPPPDTRNIIDYFKYWDVESIKTNLDTKRHNFSVLISNKLNDFNIGSVVRNSNAFLAHEVIIYGRRHYDKRGTVGMHHYENINHIKFVEELKLPDNALIVGVDNIAQSVAIETFEWPKDRHVVMVFGQEQEGIPQELMDICHQFVYIKQYGAVRSLNVGCASGIAMFSYVSKVQ